LRVARRAQREGGVTSARLRRAHLLVSNYKGKAEKRREEEEKGGAKMCAP
jgi:hypothetical protein